MSEIIEFDSVSVTFGGVKALSDVSVSVSSGQIMGVIGPNGAGKTTLLNAASGFVSPNSGTITLDGRVIDGLAPSKRAKLGLARTFQTPRLFDGLTLVENLRMARRYAAGNRPGLDLDTIIEMIGLQDVTASLVDAYDAGQKRFAEIGRCMASSPRALLLDEPATGLQEDEVSRLLSLLQTISSELACATVLVDHDMRLIMPGSDQLCVINFGAVLMTGDPQTVRQDQRVISAYFGEEDVA